MNGITVVKNTGAGPDEKQGIVQIPTGRIVSSRDQRISFADGTLTGLAESIHKNGMLTPLEVIPGDRSGMYTLVSGEKRLRAAKMLGLSSVPCVIRTGPGNEKKTGAGSDNIRPGTGRGDFFDQARSLEDLCRIYGCTQEELAAKLSVSQSYIANKLRLLRFTDEEKDMIRRSGLSERHARAAVVIADPAGRRAALLKIISDNMTVSDAEKYISGLTEDKKGVSKKEKVVLHDLRGFYNSIDNAVKILVRTGLNVTEERTVGRDEVVVRITVRRPPVGEIVDSACEK